MSLRSRLIPVVARVAFAAALAALSLLTSRTALAHSPSVSDVLSYLESEPVKRDDGVVRAGPDPKLARLLVVEVGPAWYARSAAERQKLAVMWLQLWQHTVAKGVVSILDAPTGEAVVRFRPDGTAEVEPAPRAAR